MTVNEAHTDRLLLEHFYDRPSFHCGHFSCEATGRISAIMERHQDIAHPDLVSIHSSFGWYDFCCNLCGFDARAELHRIYPEILEAQG